MLAHPAGGFAGACLSLGPGVPGVVPLRRAGCLVLDVRMPEMGGLEVQQRLAEDGIGLPIIFITAHGDVPTCAQAFKAGALDFLEKPLDGKVFLDHIRKALARGAEQKRQGPAAEFAARMTRLTPAKRMSWTC